MHTPRAAWRSFLISDASYWGSDRGSAANCLHYKQLITVFQNSSHSRSCMISKDLRMSQMKEKDPPTFIFTLRFQLTKIHKFGLKIGMPLGWCNSLKIASLPLQSVLRRGGAAGVSGNQTAPAPATTGISAELGVPLHQGCVKASRLQPQFNF